MSSTSSTSSSTATGYQLTSLNSSSQLQVTGLASGVDTNSIVQALVSTDQQQITNVTNHEDGVNAQSSELTSIRTDLQTLEADAQALMEPSLFEDTQTVTSTDPTIVSAAVNSSGTGAVQGGYEVAVTQLASSAQKTFAYQPPPSGGNPFTLTIDNQSVSMSPGESISDFVSSINHNSNLDVYAAATEVNADGSGTVVLSTRATGYQGASYITTSDPSAATLTHQAGADYAGQDAAYTINGGATVYSSSNTVTAAIPGVTLTLNGLTTASGGVAVDVSAPAPSQSNVTSALQTFVSAYNSVIGEIRTQLAQTPSSSDPTQGSLYNDEGLSDLLTSMRQTMLASFGGSAGLDNMLDLGVSTGATTGKATPSQSSIDGYLTLDTSTLQTALQSNPTGVQSLLISWVNSFWQVVDRQSGAIQSRIQQDGSQASQLTIQIANMNANLQLKEAQLESQFAQMESALSSNQSENSWLISQISSLPGY